MRSSASLPQLSQLKYLLFISDIRFNLTYIIIVQVLFSVISIDSFVRYLVIFLRILYVGLKAISVIPSQSFAINEISGGSGFRP